MAISNLIRRIGNAEANKVAERVRRVKGNNMDQLSNIESDVASLMEVIKNIQIIERLTILI